MEQNKMIEVLMEKFNISKEEAKASLEKCNWDFADTIIHIERSKREEKIENIIVIDENKSNKKEKKKHHGHNEHHHGGVGEVLGRICKLIGKIIKKGNENFLEAKKDNEKPIRISITICVLLLIFLFVPTMIISIIGLFCGYKYSLYGSNKNYDKVNEAFEKASQSADTIKKDFQSGYEE